MGELDCELGCTLSIIVLHTSRMLKIGHLAQIGGLITHCIFFWSKDVVDSFKQARTRTQPDPHWQVINKNYKEVPWWWYLILLGLSFFAGTCILLIPRPPEAKLILTSNVGLIVVLKGQTTLPWWSYIIALIVGCECIHI